MRAVVDRFEGEQAVILVKKSDLPQGTEEGSVLQIKAVSDEKETQKRRKKVKKLLKGL